MLRDDPSSQQVFLRNPLDGQETVLIHRAEYGNDQYKQAIANAVGSIVLFSFRAGRAHEKERIESDAKRKALCEHIDAYINLIEEGSARDQA